MIEYRNILDVKSELQQRVREWRNSDRVRMNMLASDLISEEQHRRWLASLADRPDRQIVRVAFFEGVPFGIITLKDIDRCSFRSDWGMYIGEECFLGRGLAKVMLFDLLVWAFEEEKLQRLYTSVLSDNAKAVALYLEHGFHFEGRFERHVRRESGELVDVYWLAVFADVWLEKKESLRSLLPTN
ncbi:MAG: UDP-4-amino-4,6-dideoxy-N-acetyl-beta-L-altrosamine N-acetyltransferase [Synergistetes bacterium ADurb.BinA166]|nr:MAG: UDP-4-amino-4,6-dideoxy-N-acetyl-beta-L-altrosamine N-acetyltransferase [Synergistetes bacterium ADurb.BinA166]